MSRSLPACWELADLAAVGDLAAEIGVHKSTITNWTTRYADFPAPLTTLSTGAVYSRQQVRQWHDQQWPTLRKNQRRQ